MIHCYVHSSAEFASLTHSQLMEKVRALQNLAYQLGVEEGGWPHNHITIRPFPTPSFLIKSLFGPPLPPPSLSSHYLTLPYPLLPYQVTIRPSLHHHISFRPSPLCEINWIVQLIHIVSRVGWRISCMYI